MHEMQIRCIDPGELAESLFAPLQQMTGMSVRISRVYTVPEGDIYLEGILPPVLTLFCDKEAFGADPVFIAQFAATAEDIIARYRSHNLNGYRTVDGVFQPASDLGVFIPFGKSIVKYYVKPNEYTPKALSNIPRTLGSATLCDFVETNESSLGTIVLWNQGHWQLFQSGGKGFLALTE